MSTLVSDDEDDNYEHKMKNVERYLELFNKNAQELENYEDSKSICCQYVWKDMEKFKNANVLKHLLEKEYNGVTKVMLHIKEKPEEKRSWMIYVEWFNKGGMTFTYDEAVAKCPVWLAFWINIHGYSLTYKIWMWCASEKYVPLAAVEE